jgi:arginase family protein
VSTASARSSQARNTALAAIELSIPRRHPDPVQRWLRTACNPWLVAEARPQMGFKSNPLPLLDDDPSVAAGTSYVRARRTSEFRHPGVRRRERTRRHTLGGRRARVRCRSRPTAGLDETTGRPLALSEGSGSSRWQQRRTAAAKVPVMRTKGTVRTHTPDTAPDGAFDWMGMAHMLGQPGARRELVDLGGRVPALDPDDVLVFGYSQQRATVAERETIARRGIRAVDQDTVARIPGGAAASALAWAMERGDAFLLHLDVDSIDFADLPLAENTDRNVGLSFEAVANALDTLMSGHLGAVTVTEANPHHGEPDGATLRRFLDRFAAAFARR